MPFVWTSVLDQADYGHRKHDGLSGQGWLFVAMEGAQ
jgi:hypothetical protein